MSDKSFRSAAYEHVANSVASLDDRIAAIIESKDIKQAYSDDFITLVALAGDNAMFDAQERLKAGFPKDFSKAEFKRRFIEKRRELKPVLVIPKGAPEWQSDLLRSEKGAPLALLANAITAIRGAGWGIYYNEFSNRWFTGTLVPWSPSDRPWRDEDDIRTAEWLQHEGIAVNRLIAGEAVSVVSRDRTVHPPREYLNSLKWDGAARLNSWLTHHLGVKPNAYVTAVGECWMISAVARVLTPGCKADCMLILEGGQGIGKSTALKTLAGEWFRDEIPDLGSKDASIQTQGVWILEIAELDALSRSEVGRIKAFISQSTSSYRPVYGRLPEDFPRQCVFAGSVNHTNYLKDETGGRRFWPVSCGQVDIDSLAAERDQLWAEAVVRFQDGDQWWLPDHLKPAAEEEQSNRYEGDAWDSLVIDWASLQIQSGQESVSVAESLRLCLEKPKGQWSRADEIRVGRCLTAGGWQKYREGSGSREWRYHSPEWKEKTEDPE